MSIFSSSAKRAVTPGQREAVEEAMTVLIEEDSARSAASSAACAACGRSDVAGSVEYEASVRFCRACATGYEIGRIEGRVRSVSEYVAMPSKRRGPPVY